MYIDKFQSLIAHSSSGEKKSIKEQVEKQISYATREDTRHLFSDAKVRKIVYYIISFLGNQAKKEASRRAKDSGGVSKCLCFLSQHCYLVRNRSDSESKQIDMLIGDEDVPTDMISKREAFGGLHYLTKSCWQLFAKADSVYSRVATSENFVLFGDRLLAEIYDVLSRNDTLRSQFACLCELKDHSGFSMDDISACLCFFLRVFS